MGIGMETKIEAPKQESGVMLSKIAPVLDREAKDLEVDDSSQSSVWRKKVGALMMAGTIFAGGLLAGSAKEAKAGGRGDSFVQDLLRTGTNTLQQSLTAGIQGSQDAIRQRQQLEADRIRTKLQLEADAIRQGQNRESDAARAKLQLEEQRARNFNDEIRAAKSDDEVAFIKRKYGMTGR